MKKVMHLVSVIALLYAIPTICWQDTVRNETNSKVAVWVVYPEFLFSPCKTSHHILEPNAEYSIDQRCPIVKITAHIYDETDDKGNFIVRKRDKDHPRAIPNLIERDGGWGHSVKIKIVQDPARYYQIVVDKK